MISNLVLQSTVEGLKTISGAEFCVLDANGNELVSTSVRKFEYKEAAISFIESPAEQQVIEESLFFKIFDDQRVNYVLVVTGKDENTYTVGRLAAFQLQSMLIAYKERFDKENFVKNLLMDNLLMVDIFAKAKKLHIEVEVPRVVFLIETGRDNDSAAMDKLKSVCTDKTKYFITSVTEKSIAVVKTMKEKGDYQELDKTAMKIRYAFGKDASHVHIAYGTIVNDLREVSRSYKEARIALDVGKIFFDDKPYFAYNTLGIGRLIYQLPIPLCKMFISEIFQDRSPDDFDEETLSTIYKFFENNLNVSETSRQLFIHRNTLVYRLDKLKKLTGLDLHSFEDAITFKIALMVVKYMQYMEKQDF